MKKNRWLVVLTLLCATLVLSGCGLTDAFKKTVEEPKDKIYGAWYDPDSKTFLVLNHDQTYTMGYGLNAVNSGGTCTIDNEHIVLSIEYVIADGKRENVPSLNKEDIVCTYSIKLDDSMVFKTGDNTVLRFQEASFDNTPIDSSNQMELTGLWKNIEVNESIRFDKKGKVTQTSLERESEGSYKINNDQVIITIDDVETGYLVKFITATRIQLTNLGKPDSVHQYEKMGD